MPYSKNNHINHPCRHLNAGIHGTITKGLYEDDNGVVCRRDMKQSMPIKAFSSKQEGFLSRNKGKQVNNGRLLGKQD